jgi:hypothetical protein
VQAARKPHLLGNSYQPGDALPPLDLVVMAGTAEWPGPHPEPLACILHTSTAPVFYLGVDYPSTELPPSSHDLQALSKSLIVARGGNGRQRLDALGIQAHMLPCPSLFSAPLEYPARALKSIGIVLQSDRVVNQAISTELKARMLNMLPALQSRFSVKIVCNYIDEYLEFRSTIDCPVCYSYDSGDYFRLLSDCDMVISTRFDGALIANSLLKPAIMTNAEPRVGSAVELCPYIFMREPEDVPGFLERFEPDPAARNLVNWKRSQEAQYLEILRGALEEHGLY